MGLVLLLASAGLIAYLGDLIGRRIGRKRLTLFGLRPKNTAIVFTVATGVVIAAITVGVILLVSRDLRQRIFGYEKVVKQLRDEATSRHNEAARSRAELDALAQDLAKQQARVLTEQKAASEAEKARLAAEQRLSVTQARYRQAEAMAARKAQEAQAAQARLNEATRRLREAQQRVVEARAKVTSLSADVERLAQQAEATKKQLADLQVQVADRAVDVKEATQAVERLANEAAQATIKAREAENDAQRYREAAAAARQDFERVLSELESGTLLFRQGDELLRGRIGAWTQDVIARSVQSLVQSVNEQARGRGVGEWDKDRLPGVVAVAVGRGEGNKLVGPADYLPALVRQVEAQGRPVWLRLEVVINCFRGRPLFYTFRVDPDRRAFAAEQEIATTTLDGSRPENDLVNALRNFVADHVRPATEAAGMLPPLGRSGEVGPDVWLPALHRLQAIGGPARLRAVATADIWIGDPLAIEFRVEAAP